MAGDSVISQLPLALSLTAGDYFPVDQGGVTKKATLAMLGNGAFIVAPGKILTVNNTITFTGTDGTTITFPATSATMARTDAAQSFTGLQTFGTINITSVNGMTITPSTGTFTLAALKTFTVNNTITFSGTDGVTITLPSTSATMARTDAAQTFSGLQTFTNGLTTPAQYTSTIATGTPPLVVASTTPVTNLYAGQNAALAGSASQAFSVADATSSTQAVAFGQLVGAVIQTVSASTATQVISSSSTYADTGLSVTITPKYATSKILVLVCQSGCAKDTGNTYLQLKLLRGVSDVIIFEVQGAYTASTAASFIGSCCTAYLDSPATTSATTYKTQMASGLNVAQVYTQVSSTRSTIVAMEIKQ